MVDPVNFTNFNRTYFELEETALFSVLVAGKIALVTAKNLDKFLRSFGWGEGQSPFEYLRQYSVLMLMELLRSNGFGCYTSKGRSVYELVRSGLDLRTCTAEDLEQIHGIGFKTSRMFLLHTRPDVDVAVLDTHILKYLNSKGYDAPRTTPGSAKKYRILESAFLELAKDSGMTVAEFDLYLWNKYRRKAS